MGSIQKYGLMCIKTEEFVKIETFSNHEDFSIGYRLVINDGYETIWLKDSKKDVEHYLDNPNTNSWRCADYNNPLITFNNYDIRRDFVIVAFDINMSFYF